MKRAGPLLWLAASRQPAQAEVPASNVEQRSSGAQPSLLAEYRSASLTDWSSFEAMRQLCIATAFTFDGHFLQQGSAIRPS